MKLHFTKMQGTGNDYVYVNMFTEKIEDASALAVRISDRHFGIGSDGLILVAPSDMADCRMIMYNADGSRGAMCGNGIRCVAKYAYEHGIVHDENITVETDSGVKSLALTVEGGEVTYVSVNMGQACLKSAEIPVTAAGETFINETLTVDDREYKATCVSMGNPHCVIFAKDIDGMDLEAIGPRFENHKWFPDRINTEFVEIIDEHTIKMRVWERGSGETISCGTGTCASVVAACLNGQCKQGEEIEVQVRGGKLYDTYMTSGEVMMKGPATTVFDGEIDV